MRRAEQIETPSMPKIRQDTISSLEDRTETAVRIINAIRTFLLSQNENDDTISGVKIGVDGYGGVGKDTFGDYLKEYFSIPKVTAGFFYRAITALYLSKNTYKRSTTKFRHDVESISSVRLELIGNSDTKICFYTGEKATELFFCITLNELSQQASKIEEVIPKISGLDFVINKIDPCILATLEHLDSFVAIGRDNVERLRGLPIMLIYLFADYDVIGDRAAKRLIDETRSRNEEVTEDELLAVRQSVITRTQKDHHRKQGRLLTLEEAQEEWYHLILNTSHLTEEEVVAIVLTFNILLFSEYHPIALSLFQLIENIYFEEPVQKQENTEYTTPNGVDVGDYFQMSEAVAYLY